MVKNISVFFCTECGCEVSGWMGKCPSCGAWNTLVSKTTVTGSTKSKKQADAPIFTTAQYAWTESNGTIPLSEATRTEYTRTSTGNDEINRILGGGLTDGSVVLVGGEPGIGKSTLLLQLADSFPLDKDILYVSGEESPAQIGMRAERLNVRNSKIMLCAETCFETIASELNRIKPALCIIDSIQTLYSENLSGTPGSLAQAREVTAGLIRLAKSNSLTVILVGHVTKDGSIAGPKTLEHMVDTVLYFEGDNMGNYRILRSIKNRFGRSNEIAFFEMCEHGLKPVDSASKLLLSGRPVNVSGSVLTSTLEGTKSLVIEIQALITDSPYGTAQRMTSGLDRNRVAMLLAICEKILKIPVSTKDVFINVIGGIKINDYACDLSVITAVVSSYKNIPAKQNSLILGEVGLTGELRPTTQISKRISEALSLGINTIILPGSCKKQIEEITNKKNQNNISKTTSLCDKISKCEFMYVDNLFEAIDVLFSDKG
ncbi:MAG: DNA repair protein RadA [Clostridia bacterium]|nr:DNA repair protein RadA [Clostridia bacterium]